MYYNIHMKNLILTVKKENKTKRGFILEKEILIEPKNNKKITIDEVNKLYAELRKKYKKRNFSIKGMAADGFHTLKAQNYMEDDLKYILESYYRSYGIESKAIKKKFSQFFYITVTIYN